MEQKISPPVPLMALLVILAAGILILAVHAGTGTPFAGMTFASMGSPSTVTNATTVPDQNRTVNISRDEAILRLRKDYPDGFFTLTGIALTERYPGKILYECILADPMNPEDPSDDRNLTIFIDAGTGYLFKPDEEKAKITIQQAEDAARKALPDLAPDEIRIRFTDYETQGMRAWEFRMIRDGREFLSGLLDKDTGELQGYHLYPVSLEAAGGSPVTRLQARAIADAEVRKRNGELHVQVIDNTSTRVAGFSGLPDPGTYIFYYQRVINTVPCASDRILIGVSGKTGKILTYSRRWALQEGAVAASPVPAVTKETATAIVEKEAREHFPESAKSLRIISADLLWMDEFNEYKTTPAPGSIPLGWSVAFDDATIRAQQYPNRGRAWVDAQNGTLLEFQYFHPELYPADPRERVIAEYGLDTISPENGGTETPSFITLDFIRAIQPDLEPYVSPKGPVRGFGTQSNGLVTVKMNQSWTENQATMDEIYGRLAKGAKKAGVDPLPCRFVWDGT